MYRTDLWQGRLDGDGWDVERGEHREGFRHPLSGRPRELTNPVPQSNT